MEKNIRVLRNTKRVENTKRIWGLDVFIRFHETVLEIILTSMISNANNIFLAFIYKASVRFLIY